MFCAQCGTKLEGPFCANCGAAAISATETVIASAEQIVIAQILAYVEQNWAEDFEEFISEIPDVLEDARAITANPNVGMTTAQLDLMVEIFSNFIAGGGYSPDERFDSLQEFIDEMDEG